MMKKTKNNPIATKISSEQKNVTKRNEHLWEMIKDSDLHIDGLYDEIDKLYNQIISERQKYESIIKVLLKEINESKVPVNHKDTVFSIKRLFTNLKLHIWQRKKNKE